VVVEKISSSPHLICSAAAACREETEELMENDITTTSTSLHHPQSSADPYWQLTGCSSSRSISEQTQISSDPGQDSYLSPHLMRLKKENSGQLHGEEHDYIKESLLCFKPLIKQTPRSSGSNILTAAGVRTKCFISIMPRNFQ